ncbi:hypothetical protein [Haloferula sp. BvORR071]|uniref:hypothetical protein n=1 Tax=Haloferula sp. BvORR071 TaxID=1396141 RepID=UPI000558793A|nr:hypothetical protein [Haloferula sp. BvORR071]
MVLLTILAVGLLSLSTISLRASSREDAMATARANARMALMLAIGELQKQAGPDQRATGTADLAGTATGDPLAVGTAPLNNTSVNSVTKGLSMVQPGTRYWTGVWNQTAATTQIYTRTPSPALKAWLISGNEGLPAANRLTPATTIASVDGSGNVSDTTKAVVLVGKNTVGSTDTDRYVGAPLVEIGGTKKDTKPVGRHGWWIGDEGVKAKFNQVPEDNPSQKMTYETMGDRRAGWETVDGFGDYPSPGAGNAKSIANVVTLPEGGLLNPSFGKSGSSESPLQRNFHAATADSRGLLVDSFNGGLRADLTAYLRSGFPDPTLNVIPTSITNFRNMKGPKWSRIKDFSDLATTTTDGGKLLVKAAPNDAGIAIAPTITEIRFVFGARMVPAGGDTYKINPCVKIAIGLGNPYPYPLKWNSALELEVTNSQPSGTQGVDGGYKPACIYNAVGQPAFVPATPSSPAVLNNAVFRIPADEIPAGEARAFTIGGPVVRQSNSTSRVTVDLKPFASSQPANFDNCVELTHDSVNNLANTLAMDMRESWTTTQITIDLRTGSGTNTLLRRLERFELDNGYYASTTRNMTKEKAKTMSRPFPMHFYGFQFSQPGNDYKALLPNPSGVDPLGLRGSTLRSFTDFNFQGKRFHKPIASYNPPPYFMESADSLANLPFNDPGGQTGDAFTRNFAISQLGWGRSPNDTKKVILFSPQKKFVSLAQLQHADMTGDDQFGSVGHQPGNAVGNSYATPFVKRSLSVQSRTNFTLTGVNSSGGFQSLAANYYDLAYLLNTALWDSYYFSAMPQSGLSVPENPALISIHPGLESPDMRDAKLAAAHLMIDGSFNVNCTRKEAWKALLSGSKHLKHPADGTSTSGDALYPRSLEQTSSAASPPTGEMEDSFAGFRRLNDAQLDALATEITRQVRMRGPFVSLSQFVNRAIADITRNKVLSRAGALQVALDESGANISVTGAKNVFKNISVTEDRVNLQANGSAPRGDLDGSRAFSMNETNPSEPVWATTSKDLNPGALAGILADRPMLTNPSFRSEQGFRSTGIPGWVTQADLLQVIGPALAARSDTFRVRAYGEATDPVTGAPIARAWCEAIVQRMPEYIDGSDAVGDLPAQLDSKVNQNFGRRFSIISFKWLSSNEI